jgi:hypothetical protein
MVTLKQVIQRLKADKKVLPDSFGDGITSVSLTEALKKYGETPCEFDGRYKVTIIAGPKIMDELVGWASRSK